MSIFSRRNLNPDPFYNGGADISPIEKADGTRKYRLRVSVSTNVGRERTNNEDHFYIEGLKLPENCLKDFSSAFLLPQGDGLTFAVFDGMGGTSYGEVASAQASEILGEFSGRLRSAQSNRMLDSIAAAYTTKVNNAILDMLAKRHSNAGGSTLAMLYFSGDNARVFYLGDSRVYLFHEKQLLLLTQDHTVANQKLKASIYTEREAQESPDRHRLTLYLGSDRQRAGLKPDTCMPVPVCIGSKFLLCSDGLTNMVEDEAIAEILSKHYLNDAAMLTYTAVRNGGTDNVTAMVIEIIAPEKRRFLHK